MKLISAFAKVHGPLALVPFGTGMTLEPVGSLLLDGRVYDLYPLNEDTAHLDRVAKVEVDGYRHAEMAITVEDVHPYLDWERYAGVISVDTKALFAFIPNTNDWNATFLPANEYEANRIIRWAQGTGRKVCVGSASITRLSNTHPCRT